jgi:dTDP-4-dehydrorhamnose reductase
LKILLTGQSGQLGNLLAPALSPHTEVISVSRQTMDLADLDQIRDAIRSIQPDLIINPAAYTAVVKAETDIAGATRINAEAPEIMAQEAQRIGAGLVHYSTDYVFDGTNSAPYTEQDTPNPINVYGQTKFAGELAIQRHCDAYWVFRTSWVYSISGGTFL